MLLCLSELSPILNMNVSTVSILDMFLAYISHFTVSTISERCNRASICMFVCYALLLDALYLGRQTFRGSSSTPRQNKGHHAITRSINNRITLCSYHVQLYERNANNYTCSQRQQGQGVTGHYYNRQYYFAISRFIFHILFVHHYIDWQHQFPRQGIYGY